MEIRKLAEQDLDILKQYWEVRKPFEERLQSMQNRESAFYIVWLKDTPIGHGRILYKDNTIEDMYIDEAYQSQGYGAKLLVFLETEIKKTTTTTKLAVDKDNSRALQFYKGQKYKVIEEKDNQYILSKNE